MWETLKQRVDIVKVIDIASLLLDITKKTFRCDFFLIV